MNQTLTMGLRAIFCSLFASELNQTKPFLIFFYILAIQEMDKQMENVKRYKERERV